MFRKRKKNSMDKDIRKSNSAIDLVPIILDYSDDYVAGKEKYFNDFLIKTRPDDLSRNAMDKVLGKEKDIYAVQLQQEIIKAKDTAEKIILLQEAEVRMISNEIEEESLLQKYITSMIEKGV